MPTTRSQASRVALAQGVERLIEVDGDRLDGLALAATAELAVDPGHRQVEQLDRNPALADVGPQEIRSLRPRREQRDRATAARGDRSGLHHEALRDQLGDEVGDRGDREARLLRDRGSRRLPREDDAAQRHGAIALAHIADGRRARGSCLQNLPTAVLGRREHPGDRRRGGRGDAKPSRRGLDTHGGIRPVRCRRPARRSRRAPRTRASLRCSSIATSSSSGR